MGTTVKRNKTVAEALQHVADHPQQSTPDTIDLPIWEMIALRLFHIANNPDVRVRGSLGKATRAQRIILDRLVGRRRAGTHPAQSNNEQLEFSDLTQGLLEEAAAAAAAQTAEETDDDEQ